MATCCAKSILISKLWRNTKLPKYIKYLVNTYAESGLFKEKYERILNSSLYESEAFNDAITYAYIDSDTFTLDHIVGEVIGSYNCEFPNDEIVNINSTEDEVMKFLISDKAEAHVNKVLSKLGRCIDVLDNLDKRFYGHTTNDLVMIKSTYFIMLWGVAATTACKIADSKEATTDKTE